MKKCLIFFVSFLLLTLTVFAAAVLGTVITPGSYYNDINSSHKYFEAIEYITKENIVHGYEDGTYKPNRLLNRAELLKILMEANYDDSDFAGYSAVSCFDDVPADQWFTKYICAAKAAGIVKGYSNNTFRPANKISLVEALKVTLKTFGYAYGPSNPWYKSVVEEASERNFIPLDFVAFDNDVTRGQMADMITRMLLYALQGNALNEYLDEKSSYKVTYQSLLAHDYVEGHIDFTGSIDNTNPGDVEDVNVTALDNGKVKVTWDAATDNVGVDGYVIYYGKTSVTKVGETYEKSKDVGKVLQYNLTGLNADTKYYFSVIAYDKAGNESAAWAPEVSVTVKTPVDTGGLDKELVSSLAADVCTDDDPSSSGLYQCSDAKKAQYNCDKVKGVKYYNYTFLTCRMTDVSVDDVLVFGGGLLGNGYNLISEKSGNVEVMTNASEVLSFWGSIDSKESAKGLAMAVTGDTAIEYGTDLTEIYGDDFIATDGANVTYTVVTKAGSDYTVPLYYRPVFGCSSFPVYEKVYGVSDSGLSLKSEIQIGKINNDMCAD